MKPNLSQEEIQMLLGKGGNGESPVESSSGAMSQSEIDNMISGSGTSATTQKNPAVQSSGGGALDQAAIDALINKPADPVPKKNTQPPPASTAESPEFMDQAAIDALIKGGGTQSKSSVDADPPRASTGSLDQSAVDNLFKEKQEQEPSGGAMDQAAVDALFQNGPTNKASKKPESDLKMNEISGTLDQAAKDDATADNKAIGEQNLQIFNPDSVETPAGGVLDQSSIDALIAGQKAGGQSTSQQSKAPVEPTSPGSLDQNAIDQLFDGGSPGQPKVENTETGTNPGSLDQSAIDQLFSGENSDSDHATPATEIEASGGSLDQAAIDQLLAGGSPTPSPAVADPESDSDSLDQAAIDQLLAGGSPAPSPSAAEPETPGGSLDQAAIDQLLAGGSPAPSPSATEPEPTGGSLDQAAIDQLLAGGSSTPSPTVADTETPGGSLDQAAIDQLFSGKAPTEETTHTPAAPKPIAAFDGPLDQSAIDQLIASSGTAGGTQPTPPVQRTEDHLKPATSLAPHIPQVPNPLGARTLGSYHLDGKKVFRTSTNPRVTGIRRSRYYLPKQVNENDAALNAVMRLLTLAKAFREVGSGKQQDPLGSFPNRFGHKTEIALTRDHENPVRITMKGITKLNAFKKYEESEQTFHVNHFSPAMGSQTKRWVDWFSTHYDVTTLQQIGQLT